MSNAETIKKLVADAQPSPANLPPEERKTKEQLDAAKQKLQSIIEKNPKQTFLIMAENHIPGLDYFTIDQLKALNEVAKETFTQALTDTGHPWYTYEKVICLFAQADNSSATLDTIMQRLTVEIEDKLGFPYRFYPMVGDALKQFETKEVAGKIIEVLNNASWFNRYVISMSLRNVCRGNPNKSQFDEAFLLLLDMAEDAEPNSTDSGNIEKCVQQVNFALNGE